MKPRIIILMHYMELGGAESALLGLLQSIDTDRVDVDLFVYDHRGDFFPLIPTDKVNLLPQIEAYSMIERPLSEVIRKGYYRLALMRLIGKCEYKITKGSEIVTQPKWASKVLPDIVNDDDALRYDNDNDDDALRYDNDDDTLRYDNDDDSLRYDNDNDDDTLRYDNDNGRPSSIVHRPSSIVHRSSSIVHRPSSSSTVHRHRPSSSSSSSSSSIYDLAISFVTPHYFALDHVKAKKKVGWIHTDYTKIPVNAKREVKMWERLDNIVSISPDVTKTFLQVFPSLKDKIVEIENILSPVFVRQRADIPTDLSDIHKYNNVEKDLSKSVESVGKEYILLSIGRICEAKNYDNVPYIAKTMKENGAKFHWYIIGPGNHEGIDRTIEETGTGDVITFLGPKTNPYPYIKACDIYLQPSRYEGKSVTVREAQVLCKPVVVTNYATAPSQINDGIDGVIVPMDNDACALGIVEFLNDKAKQQRICEYLKGHDYGNVAEVEKVYRLIDER